jgi:hypothetical protein
MAIDFEESPKRRPTRMLGLIFTSILFGYVAIAAMRSGAKQDVQIGVAGLAARYCAESKNDGERKYTDLEAIQLADSQYASSLEIAEMSSLRLIGVYLLAIPFSSMGGCLAFGVVILISWLNDSPVRKYLISNADKIGFWMVKWIATAFGGFIGGLISLVIMA